MSQLTWAKNKDVREQFLKPFEGLQDSEIELFVKDSEERCSWATRLSVEIDGLPASSRVRQIIEQQVGKNRAARCDAFGAALKQIALELLGMAPRQLTRSAW